MDPPYTAHAERVPRRFAPAKDLLEPPGMRHGMLRKHFLLLHQIPEALTVFAGAHRKDALFRKTHRLHRVQALGPHMPHEVKGFVQPGIPQRRVPEVQKRRIRRRKAEIPVLREGISLFQRETGRVRIGTRVQGLGMGGHGVPVQAGFHILPDDEIRVQHHTGYRHVPQCPQLSRGPEGHGVDRLSKAVQNGLCPVPERG